MPEMHLDTDTWHAETGILQDGTTLDGIALHAGHPHFSGYFYLFLDVAWCALCFVSGPALWVPTLSPSLALFAAIFASSFTS
ncbi:MAG TPA: hypothetical protein HA263_00780 [Methanoregulaceae archaeon]|nr:hypothetical protein [Methanoregulaceae archaeon]